MEYYNGSNLLNANCPINFSIGNRSTGKSYYWKRYCVRNFIKNNRKFMYIRRNDNDLQMSIPTFFDDIGNQFPGYSFETKRNQLILTYNGESLVCGYSSALSQLHKLKSIPMGDVDTIIFDEFIPENLRYLKPDNPTYEPELLLSVYLTVARGYKKVIRDEVKIICIANNITMYNPFFSYFGIDLTDRKTQIINGVYAETITNLQVANEIANSKIGKILSKSQYGDYALLNKPLRDKNIHIKLIDSTYRPYIYVFFDEWYCLNFSSQHNDIIITQQYDKTFPNKYKIIQCNEDEIIPWFKGDIYKRVCLYNDADKIYYSTPQIRGKLAGFFER